MGTRRFLQAAAILRWSAAAEPGVRVNIVRKTQGKIIALKKLALDIEMGIHSHSFWMREGIACGEKTERKTWARGAGEGRAESKRNWIELSHQWIKVFHQPHVGLILTNTDDNLLSVTTQAGTENLSSITR
jgi:hypothetical protein